MSLLKSNQTVAAALVAAVVSFVILILFSSTHDAASNLDSGYTSYKRATNDPEIFAQAGSVVKNSEQLATLQRKMQDIERTISDFQVQLQQIADLEQHLGELRVAIENAQESVRLNSINSPVQTYISSASKQIDTRAMEEASRQDTIALQNNLENRFQAEDVDNAWSQDTESKLLRVLEELGSNQQISVANMECKMSTCRLEVVHEDDVDLSMFQLMLSTEMSGDLPNAAVIENEIGTTFYLTKEAIAFVR